MPRGKKILRLGTAAALARRRPLRTRAARTHHGLRNAAECGTPHFSGRPIPAHTAAQGTPRKAERLASTKPDPSPSPLIAPSPRRAQRSRECSGTSSEFSHRIPTPSVPAAPLAEPETCSTERPPASALTERPAAPSPSAQRRPPGAGNRLLLRRRAPSRRRRRTPSPRWRQRRTPSRAPSPRAERPPRGRQRVALAGLP